MKHLRKIFENTTKEDLQDLCDSYFAYLYDEGFHIKIDGAYMNQYIIIIVKPKVEGNFSINGDQTFTWDEIKNQFIPFIQLKKVILTYENIK